MMMKTTATVISDQRRRRLFGGFIAFGKVQQGEEEETKE